MLRKIIGIISIAICLFIIGCLIFLLVSFCNSCNVFTYNQLKENVWFSKRALKRAHISALQPPTVENSQRITEFYGENFYGNWTQEQFDEFVADTFYFLKTNVDHVGYRVQTGSFFGAGGNYDFFDADCLEDTFNGYYTYDDDTTSTEYSMVWFDGDISYGEEIANCYYFRLYYRTKPLINSDNHKEFSYNTHIYFQYYLGMEHYRYTEKISTDGD